MPVRQNGSKTPAQSKNNHNTYLAQVANEEIAHGGDNIVSDVAGLMLSATYKSQTRSLEAELKACKSKSERDFTLALFAARLWRAGVKEGQSGTMTSSDWIISTPGIETWYPQA